MVTDSYTASSRSGAKLWTEAWGSRVECLPVRRFVRPGPLSCKGARCCGSRGEMGRVAGTPLPGHSRPAFGY